MIISIEEGNILFTMCEFRDLSSLFSSFRLSKKLINRLYQSNAILVDGHIVNKNIVLAIHSHLSIRIDYQDDHLIPSNQPIKVCYEDPLVCIVSKPSGILIHSDSFDQDTLFHRLKAYYQSQNQRCPVKSIHRLDKATSGLVFFCKVPFFQSYFDHALANKDIKRTYDLLVSGNLDKKEIIIEKPIGRDRHDAQKMRVSDGGKWAKTTFELVRNYPSFSHLRAYLASGRTHQIRVHASFIKHPILFDELYNEKSNQNNRLMLHASQIAFYHPLLNKELIIKDDYIHELINIIVN